MSNYWTDNSNFDKYVDALGSRFAAVVYVSKLARKRMLEVDNCILESQALAWVLTGVEPDVVELWRRGKLAKKDIAMAYAQDRICYIEDPEVQAAVRSTIEISWDVSHLIYLYNNVNDKCRQARVRILSNIIWDEMKLIDIDDRDVF